MARSSVGSWRRRPSSRPLDKVGSEDKGDIIERPPQALTYSIAKSRHRKEGKQIRAHDPQPEENHSHVSSEPHDKPNMNQLLLTQRRGLIHARGVQKL
jgi:hypothetical protein